jgi:hypothetical protein
VQRHFHAASMVQDGSAETRSTKGRGSGASKTGPMMARSMSKVVQRDPTYPPLGKRCTRHSLWRTRRPFTALGLGTRRVR